MSIQQTREFVQRLRRLKDAQARARILVAVERMTAGNFGDSKPVGEGVSECRIHYGPGYRLYYTRHRGRLIVLLLCGEKSSQALDIGLAKALARNLGGPLPS